MCRTKIIIYISGILIFHNLALNAQNDNKGSSHYHNVYDFINRMLEDNIPLSFKNAVYATENAYYDNELDIENLNQEIEVLVKLANVISDTELITYKKKDKGIITQHASLFRVMTDSIYIPLDSTHLFVHTPYTYDFDDALGRKDWSKMFVSKLLETGNGNCHSLPYLYKILSDELDIPCHLSFAPNHIYIKLFAESTGWYNTELTSATFPVDAWIIASGYVNIDAIRNGLYMDTLSTKQSVAHCLVDLAHGYQHKYGKEDPEFVIKCCNTTLKYHPSNVNAMLTKAEAQKHYIHSLMKKQNIENPKDLFSDTSIKEMYDDMENTYVRLHQMGYRRMPEEMYLQWMDLLQNEPEIYINQQF
jgi:hypothetical protein